MPRSAGVHSIFSAVVAGCLRNKKGEAMCLTKTIKYLGFGLMVYLGSAITHAAEYTPEQTGIQWQPWKPQVFTHAQQQDRFVLLDLTTKWCQFCRKMDKVTYRDQAVTDIIKQNYVAVRADEADYPELLMRYKNDGLPLTVVFDSQGNEIIKRSGYMKPQWMVWMLTAVAQDSATDIQK